MVGTFAVSGAGYSHRPRFPHLSVLPGGYCEDYSFQYDLPSGVSCGVSYSSCAVVPSDSKTSCEQKVHIRLVLLARTASREVSLCEYKRNLRSNLLAGPVHDTDHRNEQLGPCRQVVHRFEQVLLQVTRCGVQSTPNSRQLGGVPSYCHRAGVCRFVCGVRVCVPHQEFDWGWGDGPESPSNRR